ncbi:phosphate-starvation-inducible PsiE family protein [Acidiphilium sp. PA]|uniref:phosphate-starvation-inducible PsiE family protein n=1 Tax=Acidiphilium sp. PA TaxID=2871705 RepID=UPI002244B967|nr:phosphate-starvation-inducible PsiE family protein [Acidiphilium sp. PA]MCW8306365.1 phosphate-starvation-inducible PsiE family protein [Acidiphilium sp. PA]
MKHGIESKAYHYFEIVVVQVLTLLMAVVVVAALLHLILNILHDIFFTSFDPTNPAIFQAVFGAIFTVVIALEFKRSILVTSERAEGLVRVRVVILIGMLAIVRKLIILDLGKGQSETLFALSAAFLSLGAVYWLVRDQDRRDGNQGVD